MVDDGPGGGCPHCGGTLAARAPRNGGLDGTWTCTWCSSVWRPEELARLRAPRPANPPRRPLHGFLASLVVVIVLVALVAVASAVAGRTWWPYGLYVFGTLAGGALVRSYWWVALSPLPVVAAGGSLVAAALATKVDPGAGVEVGLFWLFGLGCLVAAALLAGAAALGVIIGEGLEEP